MVYVFCVANMECVCSICMNIRTASAYVCCVCIYIICVWKMCVLHAECLCMTSSERVCIIYMECLCLCVYKDLTVPKLTASR